MATGLSVALGIQGGREGWLRAARKARCPEGRGHVFGCSHVRAAGALT